MKKKVLKYSFINKFPDKNLHVYSSLHFFTTLTLGIFNKREPILIRFIFKLIFKKSFRMSFFSKIQEIKDLMLGIKLIFS